jgi:hypothetical protein
MHCGLVDFKRELFLDDSYLLFIKGRFWESDVINFSGKNCGMQYEKIIQSAKWIFCQEYY